MSRQHFLCSALAIDKAGAQRRFKVYKLPGHQFRIYNDRGHKVASHSSRRVTPSDIKREIATVYDVQRVSLEGSVEDGVRAATWPARYKQCANCGCTPTHRAYGGRGYCGPCYGMVKRVAELKAWDRTRSVKVEGCFLEPSMMNYYTEEEIEIFRQDYLSQAEERLADLRTRQQMRKGEVPVDGLALERKFARLLAAVRRKAKPASNADYLAEQFGDEQGRVLFILLDDIEEQIPWRGFKHQRGFDLVHERRLKQQG